MRKTTNRKSAGYKIAIYIRVSTEEQAENPEGSIKNQEMRLRDHVRMKSLDGENFGEVVDVFCDPGYSAKDMNRPALKRMLKLVRKKQVNLVLVTEISRLTRSIKDFSHMWDFLKDNGCKFQSLRDNFDTTSPAGEMILFTLANFAQFERRQLGERISNSFQARAKRGLWNGGAFPLGYEADPEKRGHLKIIPSEADIVRDVFETYLKEETLARAGKLLNDRGVTMPRKVRKSNTLRHSYFTIDNIHNILTNPAYAGVRRFETKDGLHEVPGMWPPIVDPNVFSRVQTMLEANRNTKKPPAPNRFPYVLSGLVLCKVCGDRMIGKSAHGNGGKVGYYEHSQKGKEQSCRRKKDFSCEPFRIPARIVEPAVWSDVKRMLLEEPYAQEIFEQAQLFNEQAHTKSEIKKLSARIHAIEEQVAATVERIAQLPRNIDAALFYAQIEKLQTSKENFRVEMQNLKSDSDDRETAIRFDEYSDFVSDLKLVAERTTNPDTQAAICRKLIKQIQVTALGVEIHYHVGKTHFERNFELNQEGSQSVNCADDHFELEKELAMQTQIGGLPV